MRKRKHPWHKYRYGKNTNPYDLNEAPGFRGEPCPMCRLYKDNRASPYEPIGFQEFCKC